MFSPEKKIQLQKYKTPFYFYDLELLQKTLSVINTESKRYNYHVHYAFKAMLRSYYAFLAATCFRAAATSFSS